MSKSGIVFICIFGLVIFLFAGCASDDNEEAGSPLVEAGQSGTNAGGASGASGGGVDPQATVTPTSTTPTPSATPTPTTEPGGDAVCGNNILEGNEQCDGIVPATTTCQSLNMGNAGTLTCTTDCVIDTGLCFNQDADSGAPDGYVGI